MNKKKYISIGIFVVIILIGGGIAYYFYPSAINSVIGIQSTQTDATSTDDLLSMDSDVSASSSFDPVADADSASSPPVVKKKSGVATEKAANKPAATGISATAPVVNATASGVLLDSSGGGNIISSDNASANPPPPFLAPLPSCSFPSGTPSTTRKAILNEIAWMGSPSSSSAEWMEVKNVSGAVIDLSGWQLMDAPGKIKISFATGDEIAPDGLFLLERGNDPSGASAPKIYSGDLSNSGDTLALMDPQCNVSDYLDASNGWPGGNNTTKATLERDDDDIGWHTSASPGGTPGEENSAGPPPIQYTLTVTLSGNVSSSTIASNPIGLVCGAKCSGNFASGTLMTLTPMPGPDVVFGGWSGACYGIAPCSFTLAENMSVGAAFRSTLAALPPVSDPIVVATTSASSSGGASAPASSTPKHILIAAVQIMGASSSNDMVKLYNPNADAVDMTGWKLHKKSQTGTDYSIKEFPSGSTIAAGGWFIWANSAGGFSLSVGANVSSTETLSADNSVALLDSAGNIIDAVAWGTGTDQYGEGDPYSTDPVANQILVRRSVGGGVADTGSNINDFSLQ